MLDFCFTDLSTTGTLRNMVAIPVVIPN